jgi:cytochrome c5
MLIPEQRHFPRAKLPKVMLIAIVVVGALIARQDAWALVGDRSGMKVVEAVCVACHGNGDQGAPKIGDAKAWSERTNQGLTALAQHAIDGIRQMPAHGGSPGVTEFEIRRAVTYMVNQSGGSWAEPIDTEVPYLERTGEEVVRVQCSKCHQTGESGAPRIGDIAAWAPRLKRGLDSAVLSAINGHGGMPPRGGMANLTDTELKSAVLYMFNPVGTPTKASMTVPTSVPSGRHQLSGGVDIYLGIIPTKSIPAEESTMHGGIPGGKGYYHINVSLLDHKTKSHIEDARVELTVKDPFMGDKTKQLELMTTSEKVSYGNYFRMKGWDTYSIKVHIQRSGISMPINANFKYTP